MLVHTLATQLALHYLPKTRNQKEPLKYVVLLASFGAFVLVVTTCPDAAFLTFMDVQKHIHTLIRRSS